MAPRIVLARRTVRRIAAVTALFSTAALVAVTPMWLSNTIARAEAPGTQPAADAAEFYVRAAKIVDDIEQKNISSPAASNMEYAEYPPYSADWMRTETQSFNATADVRTLVHQARSIEHADWEAHEWPGHSKKPETGPNLGYLNQTRAIVNELSDAATYQHLTGDDVAAIQTLRDILHMSDLLNPPPHRYIVTLLVRTGIRAVVWNRLNMIMASAPLSKDEHDTKHLKPSDVKTLIAIALDQPDDKAEVEAIVKSEAAEGITAKPDEVQHFVRTVNRINTEADLSAAAMACQLFKFDTGHWPASIDDLHGYLPKVPIDPLGDGKQAVGYVLIKAGLPDGSDRPLVYSRFGEAGGLFYRVNEPCYSFYLNHDVPDRTNKQPQGGQFRDAAAWAPTEKPSAFATTRPLE